MIVAAALTLALSQIPTRVQLPSENPDRVQYAFSNGMLVDCDRVKDPGPHDLAWSCTSSMFTGHKFVELVKLMRDTDREIRLMRPIGALSPSPQD